MKLKFDLEISPEELKMLLGLGSVGKIAEALANSNSIKMQVEEPVINKEETIAPADTTPTSTSETSKNKNGFENIEEI